MMISHRFYINITSGDQSAISDPFYADLALQCLYHSFGPSIIEIMTNFIVIIFNPMSFKI